MTLLVWIAVLWCVSPAQATPQEKVAICHGSNSVASPYVQHVVNHSSIVAPDGTRSGHGEHEGPVYPAEDWGDVIPPFDYTNQHGGTSRFPGLNWNADGQAIWDAGCVVDLIEEPPIESPPSTTTSTTTTTTTRPPPTTTTTTRPRPPATTTTSRPASTTTTTAHPGGTTTTFERPHVGTTTTLPITETPTTTPESQRPPGLTDPPPGVEVIPPVEAEVIGPGGQTTDLGQLDMSEREALEAETDPPAPLAGTGRNDAVTATLGLVLMAMGSILVAVSRRGRRSRRFTDSPE